MPFEHLGQLESAEQVTLPEEDPLILGAGGEIIAIVRKSCGVNSEYVALKRSGELKLALLVNCPEMDGSVTGA